MNNVELITKSITHGTSDKVRGLSCPKCAGPLKIGVHRGVRLVSAQAKCKNCDFIIRLTGLPAEPPWVGKLGLEFETKPCGQRQLFFDINDN
jgi:hypothetical protein